VIPVGQTRDFNTLTAPLSR